jgi:hypothetical protein
VTSFGLFHFSAIADRLMRWVQRIWAESMRLCRCSWYPALVSNSNMDKIFIEKLDSMRTDLAGIWDDIWA